VDLAVVYPFDFAALGIDEKLHVPVPQEHIFTQTPIISDCPVATPVLMTLAYPT
jgi:hypothetical protein